MENQRKTIEIDPGKPDEARTPEHALGTDDIGLPEDIVPEDATRPEEIRPEPGKANDPSTH
ncbi:hypothetical protein [Noviherbaspirillum galbum]|uniref:Uncharacterized protein n=1 Tax=Noviherbaspirillum galbum TaxID=2709383 RepID=A0A6B3SSG1_9BURK|nr:hypothetical protein [Noviherbaspirillum galbum]NEX60539.1 hypothetical protein [Noviherbaspirillum galbum]